DPEPFHAAEGADTAADRDIEKAGLHVVAESALGRAVAGPPEAYEELTGGTVQPYERLIRTRSDRAEDVTHLDIVGAGQPKELGVGAAVPEAIEGVVLERPRSPQAIFPAPIAPDVARFHLRVPDDVALILGAEQAHRRGQVGGGALVAMVDSGWF